MDLLGKLKIIGNLLRIKGDFEMNHKLLKQLFRKFRVLRTARLAIRLIMKPPQFAGWGMITESYPPWKTLGYKPTEFFERSHQFLCEEVKNERFNLTQFTNEDALFALETLKWRHYFVHLTVVLARQNSRNKALSMAEFGTCDGLTAYFAIKANAGQFSLSMFDAWGELTEDSATIGNVLNEYSYLNVACTQRNLNQWQSFLEFNKGILPQTIPRSAEPLLKYDWVHIDLNNGPLTIEVLSAIETRCSPECIVLFDDYGHFAHLETKTLVDGYASSRGGLLIPLPTGQAVWIRHSKQQLEM